MTTLATLALDYARRGWPVFPLEPHGKQPLGKLVPHGLKDASIDEAVIGAWWKQAPDANIGIPTGIAFDVDDIDTEAAMTAFQELASQHGTDALRFPRARTGAGGRHLFMAPTGVGNRTAVIPGMDWRGKGGYIVAPGSIHPSGEPYTWLLEPNGTLPACPEWLLELLRPTQKASEFIPRVNVPKAYLEAALKAETDELRSATPGTRNDALNRAAFALGTMLGAGWLTRSQAEAELQAAALACGLEEPELSRTIRSGLESGILQPRPAPAEGFKHGGTIRSTPEVASSIGQVANVIPMRSTEWLWRGRLPRGVLSGFDGDPERGKSQHLCLWAAHITTGKAWPDGSPCQKGNVILIGAEDSWSRTTVPRLVAAGADLSRVRLVSTIGERLLTIPEDIPILEQLVETDGVLQIGFDPLSAFLSDQVNANSEHDVRRALTPLAEMLARTNCNAVAARHLSKNDKVGNALYRGLGSIGFSAVARTVLGVAKDPEEAGSFIFSVLKNNLSSKPRSQRYRIEPVELPGGIQVSRIVWGQETDLTSDELMTAFGKGQPRREAKELLLELLAAGPVDSSIIWQAANSNGIAEKTLKRAKDDLGIKPRKVGFDGHWTLELPAEEGHFTKKATSFENEACQDQKEEEGQTQYVTFFDSPSPKKATEEGLHVRARGCPACGTLAFTEAVLGNRRCHKCGEVYPWP